MYLWGSFWSGCIACSDYIRIFACNSVVRSFSVKWGNVKNIRQVANQLTQQVLRTVWTLPRNDLHHYCQVYLVVQLETSATGWCKLICVYEFCIPLCIVCMCVNIKKWIIILCTIGHYTQCTTCMSTSHTSHFHCTLYCRTDIVSYGIP